MGALVVIVRGVNVGGHRRFRPATLVHELHRFDLVNIGATGTFVVRRPGSRDAFLTALRSKLPFDADIAACAASSFRRSVKAHAAHRPAPSSTLTGFMSILTSTPKRRPELPLSLPSAADPLVQVLARDGRFLIGLYRREMKTIGYLNQLAREFGAPVTTRSWSTVDAVMRALDAPASAPRTGAGKPR